MAPLLRLRCLWFFLLGGLGVFLPYYSLYLRENADLSGSQLGLVMATLPLMGIVAPPLWGQLADRTGARARVLRILAWGTALGYGALTLPSGFGEFLFATAALAACSSALFPLATSVTLALLAGSRTPFGHVRVWGTVGYLSAAVLFPHALHVWPSERAPQQTHAPSEPGLHSMFYVAAAMLVAAAVAAGNLPTTGSVSQRAHAGDLARLLRHGPYLRLLTLTFLANLCLRGPMALFPLYVRARGGDLQTVSQMWIWMLALEIPLIWSSGAALRGLGARGLFSLGVAAGGLRWLTSALAPDLRWAYPVQLLHGITVTGLVVGAPLYAEALMPPRLRSTGQSTLTMLGPGLGGVLSYGAAGWLFEHFGGDAPPLLGGSGALLVGALALVFLPNLGTPPEAAPPGPPDAAATPAS